MNRTTLFEGNIPSDYRVIETIVDDIACINAEDVSGAANDVYDDSIWGEPILPVRSNVYNVPGDKRVSCIERFKKFTYRMASRAKRPKARSFWLKVHFACYAFDEFGLRYYSAEARINEIMNILGLTKYSKAISGIIFIDESGEE